MDIEISNQSWLTKYVSIFLRKKTQPAEETNNNFEVELTASILAYENC